MEHQAHPAEPSEADKAPEQAAWDELSERERETVKARFNIQSDDPASLMRLLAMRLATRSPSGAIALGVRDSVAWGVAWGEAVVLNSGPGAWAFEPLAEVLSQVLNAPISTTPARWNYVLGWDGGEVQSSFIPLESMRIASDKRLTAQAFARHNVSAPETLLLESEREVQQVLAPRADEEWVLKWPIGCGGSGHRLIATGDAIPIDWPRPFVLQRFVRLERPEVFRLYGIAGRLFGWNARRFAPGQSDSPFVAHARGARYEDAGELPPAAEDVARAALESCGLLSSFGCADLMRDSSGRWLALEVNTDGLFQHIDRDVPPEIAHQINARLNNAFSLWAAQAAST